MKKLDIIKSWGEVSLRKYERMNEIFVDEGMDGIEKDIAILSVITDVPEDELYDMPIEDLSLYRSMLSWVEDFNYPKEIKFKKINIGEYECNVDVNLQHMTVAQYVDFQTYFKNLDTMKAELLSVFFIPKGKKYGEGYDVVDFIEKIKDNVDILTFNCVCFFFLEQYRTLTNNTLISLESNLRAKMFLMRRKNPMREKYKEMIEELRRMRQIHLYG